MPGASRRAARAPRRASCPIRLPEIARRDASSDGSVKYGLRLRDGALIEAVLMPGRPLVRGSERVRGRAAVASDERAGVETARRRGSTPPAREVHGLSLVADRLRRRLRLLRHGTARAAGETSLRGRSSASSTPCSTTRPRARGAARGLHGDGRAVPESRRRLRRARHPLRDPSAAARDRLDVRHHSRLRRLAARERRPNLAVSINAADEATRTRLMPITRTYPLPAWRRRCASGRSSRIGA